ncbi:hypothetical protein MKQ68_21210 [Chitinophaga horti]|uniref:Uncharacterized protein n=1 Tax=Chitinophaga horti TaxID=2920382 RepID=A0ABY6J333_9BACT|nr:hypothetical protein [Chitinophaga horti]UYQ92604.1 hypothetical protein MKQ68_21210 [Chitinophaga horti]
MKKKLILRFFTIVNVMVITAWSLSVGVLLSFKTSPLYEDVWAQLGLSKVKASNSIKESFLNGYLQYYSARNFRNIATGNREGVTRDLLAYTKEYVQGEEFRNAYLEYRNNQKPKEPVLPQTPEAVRAKYIADTKAAIENLEKTLKAVNDAEMKKSLNESLEMFKQNLSDAEKNKSELLNLMIEGEKSGYEYKKQTYANDLAAWENTYPASPNGYIKQRLQEMLDATEGVDYNAQLVVKGDKKYFVNKAYENKSSNWKMAFRAGKEVTATARAFAQAWLKELK